MVLFFSLLGLLFWVLLLKNQFNFNNYAFHKILFNSEKLKETAINECDLEWAFINKNIFLRRTLTFYYPDLKQIRIFFEKHHKYQFNSTFNVQILVNNTIKLKYETQNVNRHTIYHAEYGFLETSFDLALIYSNTTKQKLDLIYDKVDLNVIVTNKDNKNESAQVDLKIKDFKVDDKYKKHSILCNKAGHFTSGFEKDFEWWIQMNKLIGYDKIVLFNSTFTNDSYIKIFEKYKDFVELIQFQCIPNTHHQDKINTSFYNFIDLNKYKINSYGALLHFEHFSFNECFTTYRDKYKYVSIMDQDEIILPRNPLQHSIYESFNDLNQESYDEFERLNFNKLPEMIDYKTNKSSQLIAYLKILDKLIPKTKTKSSYCFKMSVYLKYSTIEGIINELSKTLNDSSSNYNYTIKIILEERTHHGVKFDFNLLIKSESEYKYAKFLVNLHKNYIEPFLIKNNQSLQSISEPFRRLYFFMGNVTTDFLWGKTIHDTLRTQFLFTHWPLGEPCENVPMKYGSLSHFRRSYNIYPSNYSITELYFDFDYFHNYFKVILKDLN